MNRAPVVMALLWAAGCASSRTATSAGATSTGGTVGTTGSSSTSTAGSTGSSGATGGCSWLQVPVPADAGATAFTAVAGAAPDEAWVCGVESTASGAVVRLLRWDGTALTFGPSQPSLIDRCDTLWSPARGELWSGGNPHHVGHFVDGGWTDVNNLDQRPASGIWGTSSANVWFVGPGDYYVHWDGTTLIDRPNFATGDISGSRVWGTAPDDLWSINNGYSVSTNAKHVQVSTAINTAYRAQELGIADGGFARDIWAADDQHVWIAASGGQIIFFDGQRWTPQQSGTVFDLNAIWGASPADVWAVGNEGVIVHWNGAAWSVVPSGTGANLQAIWGTGICDVWAAGDRGTVLHLH